MMQPAPELTRDIVLVGGGHAHALVLRKWGMAPLPTARLTLINPGPTAPYSGMLRATSPATIPAPRSRSTSSASPASPARG